MTVSMQIPQMIETNLMKKWEILSFISSNFLLQIEDLKNIKIWTYPRADYEEVLQNNGYVRLPHYKKIQYYNEDLEELLIVNFFGEAKVYQYRLQIDFLKELLKNEISLKVENFSNTEKVWGGWVENLRKKCKDRKINKLFIGSPFNIAFFHNYEHTKGLLARIEKSDELLRYVEGRLANLEEERLMWSIDSYDNSVINTYLELDFYFSRASNNFEYRQIVSDCLSYNNLFESGGDLLASLIQNNNNGFSLVIDWTTTDVVYSIIKKLKSVSEDLELAYMGKCGAIDSALNLGDIVAPTEAIYGDDKISFDNYYVDQYREVSTVCVGSPLEETRSFLEESKKKGIKTVEMELFAILQGCGSTSLRSLYYISDVLGSEHNLSVRQDFLDVRLKLAREFYENFVL